MNHKEINRLKFSKRRIGGLVVAPPRLSLVLSSEPSSAVSRHSLGEKALGLLLEGLEVQDAVISADSARLLGELALPETMEALLEYVQFSRYYSKTAGFHALMQIGNTKACSRIVSMIQKPDVYDDTSWHGARTVRFSAALAVLGLDPAQEPGYIDELFDKNDWADFLFPSYSSVILRLPQKNEKVLRLRQRTVEMLLNGKYSKPEMLAMVCGGLGVLEDPMATERLRELAGMSSRFVRGEAIFYLLNSLDGKNHAGLGEALCKSDPTEYVRMKAAAGLYIIGNKNCDGVIRQEIETETDPFLRAVAVELAGKAKMVEALPQVIRAFGDPHPYVRQCAVEAMEALDLAGEMGKIEPMLEDENPRVRIQVAKYLIRSAGGKTA